MGHLYHISFPKTQKLSEEELERLEPEEEDDYNKTIFSGYNEAVAHTNS